jgi:hypothetical protein
MARICVFDSVATADSAGAVNNQPVQAAAVRSKPVRLFTSQGELRYIGWEFIREGGAATDLVLSWFQEFFMDSENPSAVAGVRQNAPNLRQGLGLDPNLEWAREVTEDVGAAGAITHNTITRALTMPATAHAGGIGSARYVPVAVHGLWVRLAVAATTIPAAVALKVFAHVASYSEEDYLDSVADRPYGGEGSS